MTANEAGRFASDGLWRGLKTLRDHWLVLAFLVSGLFWARDTYDEFVDLPRRVSDVHQTVAAIEAEVARLGTVGAAKAVDRTAAVVFPGATHRMTDAAPGWLSAVRLAPVVPVRPECRAVVLAAYMIDAAGMWFAVETDLGRMPDLEGPQELAFGVTVHPRMAVGRAQLLVQVTLDCGSHLQVDSAPRLHFRVLEQAPDLPK